MSVYFDGERVLHRKKNVLAPGEMEKVVLTRQQVEKYPELRQITVCTEVE